LRLLYSIILTLGLSSSVCAARTIDVRLFSDATLTQSWVSVSQGSYVLLAGQDHWDTIGQFTADSSPGILHIHFKGGKLNVETGDAHLGSFSGNLLLSPSTDSASFLVKGKGRDRIYNGALIFRPNGRQIYLINRVDLEQYVAGVVESEGGHANHYEYFKAQAVLARTWAIRNMTKHLHEGYNVKDDITSQAYYSKAYLQHSQQIEQAVRETADTVLLDENGDVVFGAFHANSGGETVNSEDVWRGSISYLRAVPDTFSLRGEKAFWEVRIQKEEFLDFFAAQLDEQSSDSAFCAAVLAIHQESRMPYFDYAGKKLKMRWVREKFALRSTFFTVVDEGETILLKGRGFGHGIGMSQEGAMRMAELGFDYKQILTHYFNHVEFAKIPEQPF
jgi:stage II sporulation protein D